MSFLLKGDDSSSFDLAIVEDLFKSIKTRMPRRSYQDDYVFQSHLRLLASIYYFLGGKDFTTRLFERVHRCGSERMIEKWIAGDSVPSCGVRKQAIDSALSLIEHLLHLRRGGATLGDVTSH